VARIGGFSVISKRFVQTKGDISTTHAQYSGYFQNSGILNTRIAMFSP
jgi:hypothetical protein